MKLSYLLIPAIMGITSTNCQAQETKNLQAHNPAQNQIPISQPQEPKKPDEKYQYIKAVIRKQDDSLDFLEKTEIKYKK